MQKTFSYVGVKSGYLAFQVAGLRGTVYVPKGFFAANSVPSTFVVDAPFAEPAPTPASVSALQAEIEALKAQLAASAVPATTEATPEPVVPEQPAPAAEEPVAEPVAEPKRKRA